MALLDFQDEKTVGQIWQKGLVSDGGQVPVPILIKKSPNYIFIPSGYFTMVELQYEQKQWLRDRGQENLWFMVNGS